MAVPSVASALAKRLEGKVALITGGATGIGRYTAKLFAQHGAKVAIVDARTDLAQSVANDIGSSNSIFFGCDVTNDEDFKNVVDKTVSKYKKLDIMFNNIDFVGNPKPNIINNNKADFERVLTSNVTGVFLGMKHAARVMIDNRSGVIISTSSVAAGTTGVAPHVYTCSEYGMVGLTRSLAAELGQYGIRVNCVLPFGYASLVKQFPDLDEEGVERLRGSIANLQGSVLRAEDVANAALFLASDEAKYVSGQNLFVDGGISVCNTAVRNDKSSQS